jgi:hypothetical protein
MIGKTIKKDVKTGIVLLSNQKKASSMKDVTGVARMIVSNGEVSMCAALKRCVNTASGIAMMTPAASPAVMRKSVTATASQKPDVATSLIRRVITSKGDGNISEFPAKAAAAIHTATQNISEKRAAAIRAVALLVFMLFIKDVVFFILSLY